MALKHTVLGKLADSFFSNGLDRHVAFGRFLEKNPAVADYARFRATGERQRTPWPSWPQPARDGVLKPRDYDEEAYRYHLYGQWAADEQVRRLREKADQNGQQMYLDLPLGVHPHGYDVWRERGLFALDASTGAPPDAVFTRGQDWGFPPLHPERLREQRYRYFIAYLRHHLRHARLLRIDHVMGLHRLFWIPEGVDASEGVYVRYPAEELYAILSLESHRHSSSIVGENLGTVPAYVNQAMGRHGVSRMYVVQYEMSAGQRPLHGISSDSVASLNTHDMPPFAAFWQDMDIDERLALGLVDKAGAYRERRGRQGLKRGLVSLLQKSGRLRVGCEDTHAVLKGCLALLGGSRARVVLVNLEDLWLETRPQNIPGTVQEYSNWRRKARYSLEEFRGRPEVVDVLRETDRLRKRQGGENGAA